MKTRVGLKYFVSYCIYGKTIEKLRNRIDVKLVKSKKDFKTDIKTKLNIA